MPICVTALCGRVSVQAQAGFAPAAIIPKAAVPIDPKQERHISMQSAKSPETAATSAQKKNGKKKKIPVLELKDMLRWKGKQLLQQVRENNEKRSCDDEGDDE